MKKRFKVIIALLLALALMIPVTVYAVPAPGMPVTHVQSDGSEITVILKGDEFYHYLTDENDNLLIKDENGDYKYMFWNGKDMTPVSGRGIKRVAKARILESKDARDRYSGIGGNMGYGPIRERKLPEPATLDRLRASNKNAGTASLTSDIQTLPLITIVVSFNNIGYSQEKDWHKELYETERCLCDYYYEMSGGKFTFAPAEETCAEGDYDKVNDGVIHVTVDMEHRNWSLKTEEMNKDLSDALNAAADKAAEYIDLTGYDRDGDGEITNVDMAISFIFAGYDGSCLAMEGETGYEDDKDLWDKSVWAHQYYMSDGDDFGHRISYGNGKTIVLTNYVVMGEKQGVGFGCTFMPAVILYHELGHYLGLPDLYDTAYLAKDDPEAIWFGYDVDELSIMSGGNWAVDRNWNFLPTALDAWCRTFLGWNTPEIIKEDGEYEIRSQESLKGYNVLKILTERENEYYLLENRRAEGQDEGLWHNYGASLSPNGIVLWHIDEGAIEKYECPNDVDHRPGIMPFFAEKKEGGPDYTFDLKGTEPDKSAAMFSRMNFGSLYGDVEGSEEGLFLSLYGGNADFLDTPDDRILSQTRIFFTEDDSRDMKFTVSGVYVPEPEPESEPDTENGGKPLSELVSANDIALLENPGVNAAEKNMVAAKIDRAIENRVIRKKTVRLVNALNGSGNSGDKEYWVKISMNNALRYDGRKRVFSGMGKSSKSKAADFNIQVYYCEKAGDYAAKCPDDAKTGTNGLDGWTEAKVKKAVVKNAKNATLDYKGTKPESIKGLGKTAYLSSIALEDKELNKALGKALNKEIKALAKKLKADKTSSLTDGDLDKADVSEEKQLIIPIYPLFIGTDHTNEVSDGNGEITKYTVEEGSFDAAKKKLSGAGVSMEFKEGQNKEMKLVYSAKKDKDFLKDVSEVKAADGSAAFQLTATGNFFGFIDHK